MSAGRKFASKSIPSSPDLVSSSSSVRNLGKNHLGGVIFGCNNNTIKECLFKQLFGLPAQHFSYVKNIDPGLPLFLFNYSNRKLSGIFEAASPGQMNINPYGWTTDGSERTLYPAQVQILVRMHCQPLPENQFKPIISDNYYTETHFWFELDHAQATRLMSLFSLAVAPSTSVPQNTAKCRAIFWPLPLNDVVEKSEGFKPLTLEIKHSNQSSQKLDSTDVASSFDGYNQISEAHSNVNLVEQDEKEVILMKLKELARCHEHQDLPTLRNVENTSIMNEENPNSSSGVEENEDNPQSSSECQSIITQLIQEVQELKAFNAEQTQKISILEQKLMEAEMEILLLKDHCVMLEPVSNPSNALGNDTVIEAIDELHVDQSVSDPSEELVNETVIDSFDELHLDPNESIYLIGGYDGESWLSSLNSYHPSQDMIKSLKPMSTVRSYSSAAQLKGELYVFGGGNGYVWYDTVESYNPANDEWTLQPPLNQEKGSLAGATIDNKIFAIGGGNGIKSFSEVEMLDLDIGRWISTRSMLEKRFALAAAELNGVLYATGGYDGNDYLNSAERFDPREHSWTRIASMNTKRGSHSLVVFNEKLYALGGYDGNTMVPSVEIFDPRQGSWICGEPMVNPRGYSAAGVIKDSIYVIGGIKVSGNVVDTVETYKDGQGWQETHSKALGKRCFTSAFVCRHDVEGQGGFT
ncbi:hypothetical protein I3843_10G153000 [Carya illinoinensis]|nr:uncharacterized protein LOC122278115 isoform X1 [Carya illinoinensis]KAG6640261.1 hypothetical protein CIPAW_10G160700 [Carya illinoinensis]KAG6693228.1 hypothetical protein I3842_10G158400 [Carya illinoinensis]KAG7960935.1 hypothetical protein I3843_10G153000 [Carya illinoinensis]